MEVDTESGQVAMEPIVVSGKLFHFNKGAAFLTFSHDACQGEQICLFARTRSSLTIKSSAQATSSLWMLLPRYCETMFLILQAKSFLCR